MIKNIKNLDIDNIMFEIWEYEDVQELIINLNTEKQLFELGIDSKEKELGEYAPKTIEIKKASGLPFDRITLYQDGDFYNSFIIEPNSKGFIIRADTQKESQDLATEFGNEILGLTGKSKEELIRFILKYVIKETKKRIFAGV